MHRETLRPRFRNSGKGLLLYAMYSALLQSGRGGWQPG